MSARVNLPVSGAVKSVNSSSLKGASMVLPHDMMHKCVGRVVLVLLSSRCGGQEAELVGKLAMVEDDGSLVLDDCTHYAVTYACGAEPPSALQRTVVRKCLRAMVNTKHICCVTPQ
jgi:hypothetical protein